MSTHRVPVVELVIEEHPDADRLELAVVGGWRCVVGKGEFRTGDKAAYIPDGSLLSEEMLARLGEVTRKYLAGANHDRVKAARLRGVVSQGLIYAGPEVDAAEVGDDLADVLGVTKYLPPIPTRFSGTHRSGPRFPYDIENIESFPGVFTDGEPVVMTEKLHGTWCGMVADPEWGLLVSSKGQASKGRWFKTEAEENAQNVYVRNWREHGPKVQSLADRMGENVAVLGEVYGAGIQDLGYGIRRGTLGFRVFDISVDREWMSPDEMVAACAEYGLETVPRVWEGPWSRQACEAAMSGRTLLDADHIREGVVIRPLVERRDDRIRDDGARLGRVILKAVSPAYLFRGGRATEHE